MGKSFRTRSTFSKPARQKASPTAKSHQLLEFARNEEKESTTQNLKRNKFMRAQYLVNQGEYDEAIAFLETALGEIEDPSLRLLLDQAANARQAVQRQVESALAAAGKLVQAGKDRRCLAAFARASPRGAPFARVQMAMATLEDEQSRTLFRMAGRAYAALDSDLQASHGIMQRVGAASVESSATAAIVVAFRTREQASADRALAEATQKSETLVRNRDTAAAEALVHQTDLIAELASPQRRNQNGKITPAG